LGTIALLRTDVGLAVRDLPRGDGYRAVDG